MKELRILFTGVGRRIELLQAFRSAALVLNKNLKIYGVDMEGTAPALIYCDYTRKTVAMKDKGYIDNLLSICSLDKIDLLIPTIDTDLLILSENKKMFDDIGTKVMISEPDMVRICRNKNYTSQFFTDCGLHAPATVNSWKDYRSGYPAFIKPKDGSSSINAYKVENEDELKIYATQIDDYIIQPFLEGKEYTIDIFCDWEGNPISIVPRERLQVRAGEVLKTKINMDLEMINEAKMLCKAFKPCGPITVQLIRSIHNGIDYFIEINPRFGGGVPLSMKAGARSAEAILKLLSGEKVKFCSEIEDGSIYSRFDQSVCIREGKGKIRGVIFDLDDTLYSEKEYIKSGYKAVADFLGDETYFYRLLHFFESGKPAIDELLKEIKRDDMKSAVLDVYRTHKPNIHLYDNIDFILKSLHNRDIKIGIITDGRPVGQRNKIEALGLNHMVDDILVTDELGGTQFRKPCDIAFRILLTKWKLPANEVVYVGDNPVKDFQGSQQLGMKSIMFLNKDSLYYDLNNIMPYITTINSISELSI